MNILKNKKAVIEAVAKHLLWAFFFALLLAGVYFLIKFLTTV